VPKHIPHQKARNFLLSAFTRAKVPPELAKPVVDGLVQTSLRGVDSHGIRLAPAYINNVLNGRINLEPKMNVKRTSGSTALLDADNTFGIPAGIRAMDEAIRLAKKNGIGAVSVVNSTHFSAAAIYSLRAAKRGMIGISFTNATPLVIPYGGKKPFLGTNPICFAAPCDGEEPFCLDMATSTVARNKLLSYKEKGLRLEEGWATDNEGMPTEDASAAKWLLPLGGYKGYGLGLMIEILCSCLGGTEAGPKIESMYENDSYGWKKNLAHFFIAIDVSRFQRLQLFKRRTKTLLNELRHQTPLKKTVPVMVAGDPEKLEYRRRIKGGVPLTDKDLEELGNLAEKFGLKRLDPPGSVSDIFL
jgi:ureidoglycolate dehydrogenase (NAD+)